MEVLRNGGFGTRHIATSRVVPHVLAPAATSANAASGGLIGGLGRFLTPVVSVLNLGAGIFAGYQAWQTRQDVQHLGERMTHERLELLAAQRLYTAEIQMSITDGVDQISRLLREQDALNLRARMAELQYRVEQMPARNDKETATKVEDAAMAAVSWAESMLVNRSTPMDRFPVSVAAVQAFGAWLDALVFLGRAQGEISCTRDKALALVRSSASEALRHPLAESLNLDVEGGLWLPHAYATMRYSLEGAAALSTVPSVVVPTSSLLAELTEAAQASPSKASSALVAPDHGPIDLAWTVIDAAEQDNPSDGRSVLVPSVATASTHLGYEPGSRSDTFLCAALELREETLAAMEPEDAHGSVIGESIPREADSFVVDIDALLNATIAWLRPKCVVPDLSGGAGAHLQGTPLDRPEAALGIERALDDAGRWPGATPERVGTLRGYYQDAVTLRPDLDKTERAIEYFLQNHDEDFVDLEEHLAHVEIGTWRRLHGAAPPQGALAVDSWVECVMGMDSLVQGVFNECGDVQPVDRERINAWLQCRLGVAGIVLAVDTSRPQPLRDAAKGLDEPWGSLVRALCTVRLSTSRRKRLRSLDQLIVDLESVGGVGDEMKRTRELLELLRLESGNAATIRNPD